ncbi:MAG: hypothetical protein QXR48_03170 [Candidatus Woesearchaeota archaeon]
MVVTVTVRGPSWFFGIDCLFECFAAIALLLVTLFSFKAYKFTKDKRYRTFATGFGLMLLGMVSRAIADMIVYSGWETKPILLLLCYAGYMGLTLVSLVVLFALTMKTRQKAPFIALLLVSLALILYSTSYRLSFHTISLILLVFISYHFIRNYFEKKSLCAFLVCSSFVLLGLAQVAFMFDILKQRYYIVGHLIHLLAYAALLVALVRILRLPIKRKK